MTMALEIPTYINHVRIEGERLAAASQNAMDRPIPSCPKWNGADLVFHVGRVHRMFADVLARSITDESELQRFDRPDDSALLLWYRDGLANVVDTMTKTPRTMPAWTFVGTRNTEWVVRRLAHETAVHAWDMADATGSATSVDAELASDGIDEFLSNFVDRPRADAPALRGSVHIHCTDVDGEWIVEPNEDGSIEVAWGHLKADVALRGSANDLLMSLWRRRPLSTLEVLGDEALAAAFVERAQL